MIHLLMYGKEIIGATEDYPTDEQQRTIIKYFNEHENYYCGPNLRIETVEKIDLEEYTKNLEEERDEWG